MEPSEDRTEEEEAAAARQSCQENDAKSDEDSGISNAADNHGEWSKIISYPLPRGKRSSLYAHQLFAHWLLSACRRIQRGHGAK